MEKLDILTILNRGIFGTYKIEIFPHQPICFTQLTLFYSQINSKSKIPSPHRSPSVTQPGPLSQLRKCLSSFSHFSFFLPFSTLFLNQNLPLYYSLFCATVATFVPIFFLYSSWVIVAFFNLIRLFTDTDLKSIGVEPNFSSS